MRNQKGITLTSLAVYVAIVLVAIILLARISTFFTSNMAEISKDTALLAELDKFNTYFMKDAKESSNSISAISTNSIEFSNGNIYSFSDDDEVIYFEQDDKKIAISEGIEDCTFTSREENDKIIISVNVSVANETKQYEYVMGYENVYKDYKEGLKDIDIPVENIANETNVIE